MPLRERARGLFATVAVLPRHGGVMAEGTGATAFAAVLAGKISGRVAVVPICGRNRAARVDARVPDYAQRQLVHAAA